MEDPIETFLFRPIENWIGWYSWRISFFHLVEQVFATSTMAITLLDTRVSLFGMRVRIVLEIKLLPTSTMPREHIGQLKLNWFDINDTFLFFTKKCRMCGLGCPRQRCQTSAEVERHVDEKTWGNDVANDSNKTYRPYLLQLERSTFFVMWSLT